ncbi:hypothetical protein BST45_07545 [Mycobacterium shinjukuense]|uniref:Uncharacterized protein n=1 Tax=Mycobacterium shinjukuense TaxID=398694 RepID=A0A7I7MJG2_9MYCO|nr:hypothetical protein BST45_07545 [Mycobacterium shinjukuense]BBX72328.1 hypothetical protein MSHI_02340 [Mycobacterium shinjukuense]
MVRVNGAGNVGGGLPGADGGDLCHAGRFAEVGIMSAANAIGLTLAILIALLLVAALLHPEKF